MRRISHLAVLNLIVTLIVCGCSTLTQRSRNSGYMDHDTEQSLNRDRQINDRQESADELGIHGKNLSEAQTDAINLRTDLRKAEAMLDGRRDREQYFSNKAYMKNDRERLEFLRLGSFDNRARWLNAKSIQGSATHHPPEIQSLIDINDITLGMTKQAVRDSWGEPELVEVAGNPIYGNERWHYTEQVSSMEGFQTEHRLVYFESGRVVGWETH